MIYFDQVRCTYKKLGQILDALFSEGAFSNSTIIILGDHGSRISINAPSTEKRDEISAEDLIDSYSTLFAVRSPDSPSATIWQQRSIQSLFAEIALDRRPSGISGPVFTVPAEPRRIGGPYLHEPMPELGR
jgi:arylsulfatase A-like enzyme